MADNAKVQSGVADCRGQFSADSVTAELQTSFGINIRSETVRQELQRNGFPASVAQNLLLL